MVGQKKEDQPCWEQEQIESCPYREERSLRPKIKNNDIIGHRKTDQLNQDGEQMQSSPNGEERSLRVTISNNHKIDQIKADKMSKDQEDIEGSFQIEERGLRLAPIGNQIINENEDIKQELIPDQKQMQSVFHGDSLDKCKANIMLEDSKSSLCSICKSKRPSVGWQKDFTYKELLAATNEFSIKNSLSEGAYGPTFKGQLHCNLKIVVKKLQMTSSLEEKIYKSEVQLLTRAKHENVVMLLGSCIEETKLLIVYENACNGALDQYISGGSHRSLTWRERVKIAIGASRGLKYLHENNIIHGNIKPSNIFLTHKFESLLGDFGFGKAKNELKDCQKDKNDGNSGYMAPEFMESGQLSTKTDVYSFGMVLLELITGHRVTDKISGQRSLVEWAKPLLRGCKYPQLVDQNISSSCDDQELFSLVQVTEKCLRKNPTERLTMNMVISALPCLVATSSQDNEESPAEDDLNRDVSQEIEKCITCRGSNQETNVSQESMNHITCCGSNKEAQETERLSPEVYQESQRCISYGGARNFFLGGAKEYIVDKHFFRLCT